MSGLFQLLTATFLSGLAAMLFKKSTAAMGAANTTLFYYVFGAFWAALIWWFASDRMPIEKPALVWPALTAFAFAISVILFNRAIQTMPLSVASPIYGMSFLVTFLITIFVMGEPIVLKNFVALGLAIASVVVFSL